MDSDEKICPFCAETIKSAAIKCRYCGSDLSDAPSVVTAPKSTKTMPQSVIPSHFQQPQEILTNITYDASCRPLVPAFLAAIIIGAGFTKDIRGVIIPCVIAAIYVLGNAIGKHLTLTDRQVIFKEGILSNRKIEIQFDKLDSISLSQGIFGRILNYGHVNVGGSGTAKTPSPCINDPEEVRREIVRRSEIVKSLNGKHQQWR